MMKKLYNNPSVMNQKYLENKKGHLLRNAVDKMLGGYQISTPNLSQWGIYAHQCESDRLDISVRVITSAGYMCRYIGDCKTTRSVI